MKFYFAKVLLSWPTKNKLTKLVNEKQIGNLKGLGKWLYLPNEKRNVMLGN